MDPVTRALLRFEKWVESHTTYVYSALLIIMGVMTMGFWYTNPPETQWDEVYYIPVVARYQSGTFFMESHPPFGKLLMTLGDKILNPNANIDQSKLLRYDATGSVEGEAEDDLPVGYDFRGIRLVPVIAGIFVPLIIMAIVILLTRRDWLGFIIGMSAALDNAFVLQFRGAMLDSILLMLMLGSVYFFIRGVQEYQQTSRVKFGTLVLSVVMTALAVSTKYNALILLVPLLILCYLSAPKVTTIKNSFGIKILAIISRSADAWTRFLVSLVVIGVIFISIFAVHFGIARNLDTTQKNNTGYFGASDALKEKLNQNGGVKDIQTLVYAVGSGIAFTVNYHAGVPGFDACEKDAIAKSQLCNGSRPWMWPLMGRSVNFRWSKFASKDGTRDLISMEDYNTLHKAAVKSNLVTVLSQDKKIQLDALLLEDKSGTETLLLNREQTTKLFDDLEPAQKENINSKLDQFEEALLPGYTIKASYYTLIGNPVTWFIGLLGLIGAAYLLLASLYRKIRFKQSLSRDIWSLVLVASIYIGYMILASASSRILYLYHYFFGLALSLILFAQVILISGIYKHKYFQIALSILLVLIVCGFLLFSPFTYSLPLSDMEFRLRNWLDFWVILKLT